MSYAIRPIRTIWQTPEGSCSVQDMKVAKRVILKICGSSICPYMVTPSIEGWAAPPHQAKRSALVSVVHAFHSSRTSVSVEALDDGHRAGTLSVKIAPF